LPFVGTLQHQQLKQQLPWWVEGKTNSVILAAYLLSATKGKRGGVDFYCSCSMTPGTLLLPENGCGDFNFRRWIQKNLTS
jgi:hypothetical protein